MLCILYIYIYIERERDIDRYICIYIYICIHTHIPAQDLFQGLGGPGTLFSMGNAKIFQGLGPLRRTSCDANWEYKLRAKQRAKAPGQD